MAFLKSVFRYIFTLGGLLGGKIDQKREDMLATPAGIKAHFAKIREKWTKQYAEVRDAVAQMMMVIEQKKGTIEKGLEAERELDRKMKGAVQKYKDTKDEQYKAAFATLHTRHQQKKESNQRIQATIDELQEKVDDYKAKLTQMQERIQNLNNQEAEAIADIVTSQQIIKLNDTLKGLSADFDEKNLIKIEERRMELISSAKLSSELADAEDVNGLESELLAAGMSTEANDLFAAMIAEDKDTSDEQDNAPLERAI